MPRGQAHHIESVDDSLRRWPGCRSRADGRRCRSRADGRRCRSRADGRRCRSRADGRLPCRVWTTSRRAPGPASALIGAPRCWCSGAGGQGRGRTDTPLTGHRLLRPARLPFRHSPSGGSLALSEAWTRGAASWRAQAADSDRGTSAVRAARRAATARRAVRPAPPGPSCRRCFRCRWPATRSARGSSPVRR